MHHLRKGDFVIPPNPHPSVALTNWNGKTVTVHLDKIEAINGARWSDLYEMVVTPVMTPAGPLMVREKPGEILLLVREGGNRE